MSDKIHILTKFRVKPTGAFIEITKTGLCDLTHNLLIETTCTRFDESPELVGKKAWHFHYDFLKKIESGHLLPLN